MTARRIVVVDLETTSVDPDRAVPLEIAAVEYKPDAPARRGQVVEYVPPWNPHVLAAADPVALAVNRYYERRVFERTVPPEDAAAADLELFELLAGANAAYDATVLRRYLAQADYEFTAAAPWHYRLLDVEVATAAIHGFGDGIPSLRRCRELWDLPAQADAHTALADAIAAHEVLAAILDHRGGQR